MHVIASDLISLVLFLYGVISGSCISSGDCLCVKICISSHVVGPRHPLRKDPNVDYDVSSDEEWEEVL
jgi:hypothetical protein